MIVPVLDESPASNGSMVPKKIIGAETAAHTGKSG
jgi:hypothetical protein